MSLGTYNNSNNSKKDYSPVTYSAIRFFNSESNIDSSSMSFSFWKGLLKISISPIKTGEGSNPEIDKDNAIDIYLTPIRASLLLKYISMYELDPHRYDNVGVSTNKGLIYITTGTKEFGVPDGRLFIVIKILDQNDGRIKSAIAYEFSKAQCYGIVNYENSDRYEKNTEFASNAELDLFCNVLRTYVESSSYAMAASVVENMKYDVSRMTTRISTIQEKLGIDTKSGYKNGGGYKNSSYFDKNGGGNSSSGSSSAEQVGYDELINDISSAMMND